jgi:hypothetical protein
MKFVDKFFLRLIFDNSLNIIVVEICVELFKGIIVDKFRSLKDALL